MIYNEENGQKARSLYFFACIPIWCCVIIPCVWVCAVETHISHTREDRRIVPLTWVARMG